MAIALSKLTAQGQISVPVEVRRRLGVGPGSVLEWEDDGDRVVVRRAGTHSSEDIHAAVFSSGGPVRKSLGDLKRGLRDAAIKRHARG